MYQARLPDVMIPHQLLQPTTVAPWRACPPDVPTAPEELPSSGSGRQRSKLRSQLREPVDNRKLRNEDQGGSYRVIRKQNGFIFRAFPLGTVEKPAYATLQSILRKIARSQRRLDGCGVPVPASRGATESLATPRGPKIGATRRARTLGASLGVAPPVTAPQLGCSFVPPPISAPKSSRVTCGVFNGLPEALASREMRAD